MDIKFEEKGKRKHLNVKDIIEYWKRILPEVELNVDWCSADKRCWSCGDECKTEQCHIIPHSLGGKSEPNNIVLLCKQCHKENPNTISVKDYILWLKSRKRINKTGFYGGYWFERIIISYKEIYQSDLIDDLRKHGFPEINILDMANMSCSDGQRHNPATMAVLIRTELMNIK